MGREPSADSGGRDDTDRITSVSLRDVVRAWWPLAMSWGLMGAEQPVIGAVIARLLDPKIHLAAYGGVVFPVALVIEAPVIMLLAASTELSRDRLSHRALRRFSHQLGAALTAMHAVIAFTPVGDVLVRDVLGAPADVVEPARLGLIIMTPWTWAIAWRRFNQGVLIRFGRPGAVTRGTLVRLVSSAVILGGGLLHGGVPGIVVGCTALTVGVFCEALYASVAVRPVVAGALRDAPPSTPLSGRAFAAFFVPLALTPLITLLIQPLGSAAIARMPEALSSLAIWPIVSGLVFVLQSFGIAYNEVVVALWDKPNASEALRRFSMLLLLWTTGIIALLSLTPLADLWMGRVAGLSPELAVIGAGALWLALPIPGCRALQSWYQGQLVVRRKTRPITEAVVIFFVVCTAVLWVGVAQQWRGLEVALAGFSLGRVVQTAWLALRARRA
ncbi:MAG: hypothetical protein AAF721_24475 [Myxococcota bacterium]